MNFQPTYEVITMNSDELSLIVLMVILGIGIVLIAVLTVVELKKRKNCTFEDLPESEVVVKKAEVISKYVDTKRTGSYRQPNHHLVYRVIFRTENGETIEYSVPIEIFNACEPHITGDLVTVDGDFLDFGEGEDL